MMSGYLESIEQSIGDVTLDNGSTAKVGIFNSYHASEQQNAQQALFFREMDTRLHEISNATSGTCSWILENQTFKNWQNAQFGLLWIKGKPGVGKSTIMKYTRNHFALEASSETSSKTSSKTRITASFFCHGRGVDAQRSSSGVYRALLHQIFQQAPSMLEDFEKRFQAHCKPRGSHGSAWDWTESELKNLAHDHLLRSCHDSELLIFVDALDECGEDSARELLAFFQDLVTASEAQNGHGFKMCVSSRHYPLVRSDVSYEIVMDGENLADIRTYVAEKLESFRRTRRYDELLSAIASRAGEIFQWCILVVAKVVRSLEGKKSVELILQEIQETPRELFRLYRQIVRSYVDNTNVSPRDRKQFSDLFQWVALAKRPLSVLELGSALSINDFHESAWDSLMACGESHENGYFGADIGYLSCGLTKIAEAEESNRFGRRYRPLVIGFIHHSVQEYFVSGGGIHDFQDPGSETRTMRMVELDIVRICYKSILLSQPQADAHTQHPLLDYALEHMFDHAHLAEKGQPMQNDLVKILNFPEDDCASKMSSCKGKEDSAEDGYSSESLNSSEDDSVLNLAKIKLPWRSKNRPLNLLHLAAAYDIPNLIGSVLDLATEVNINIRGPQGITALHLAAESGYHNVIDKLLDINQTCSSKSMLHWRQRRMRGLQLNVRDREGTTPLMLAAENGESRAVERLAQTRRVDLNAKDRVRGFTALHLALEFGHADTAKILMRYGADCRVRSQFQRIPLSLALETWLAGRGGGDIFAVFLSILTQARQDIYFKPPYEKSTFLRSPLGLGLSPLELGLSSSRSLEFAQGLLDRGFDPHTPDQHGCVWFSYLDWQSNPKTLDLLQALPGANINFKDKNGRTLLALLSSSRWNHDCSMISRLLENPAVDVNTKDKHGKTPLMLAAEKGPLEVLETLLADTRCDPQAVDKKGNCALDYARGRWATNEKAEMVALLESSCS